MGLSREADQVVGEWAGYGNGRAKERVGRGRGPAVARQSQNPQKIQYPPSMRMLSPVW